MVESSVGQRAQKLAEHSVVHLAVLKGAKLVDYLDNYWAEQKAVETAEHSAATKVALSVH